MEAVDAGILLLQIPEKGYYSDNTLLFDWPMDRTSASNTFKN